jgi:hypothetical protein
MARVRSAVISANAWQEHAPRSVPAHIVSVNAHVWIVVERKQRWKIARYYHGDMTGLDFETSVRHPLDCGRSETILIVAAFFGVPIMRHGRHGRHGQRDEAQNQHAFPLRPLSSMPAV